MKKTPKYSFTPDYGTCLDFSKDRLIFDSTPCNHMSIIKHIEKKQPRRKWNKSKIYNSDDGIKIDFKEKNIQIINKTTFYQSNYIYSFDEVRMLYSKLSGVIKIINK